jgi:transketolase
LSFKKRKKDNKVFVLIGDGECNEGSVWEAAMSSVHHNLDNLTIIVDHNGFQQTGSNNEINKVISLKNKWQSFGLEVIELDGHNITDLINAFEKKFEKPKLILANTVKGKGFSFSENNNDWHHKILTKTNYDQAIKELNSNYGI